MNQYVTGAVIKELREKNNLTQVAAAFHVSITELLSGNTISNMNVSSNVMRSKIYVCPICGNVIYSMGEAVIHCHGVSLTPCETEETNESYKIFIERSDDEYYVQIEHDITKKHYISFIAAVIHSSV